MIISLVYLHASVEGCAGNKERSTVVHASKHFYRLRSKADHRGFQQTARHDWEGSPGKIDMTEGGLM